MSELVVRPSVEMLASGAYRSAARNALTACSLEHTGSIGSYRLYGASTACGPQQADLLPHAPGRNSVSAEWLGRLSL